MTQLGHQHPVFSPQLSDKVQSEPFIDRNYPVFLISSGGVEFNAFGGES